MVFQLKKNIKDRIIIGKKKVMWTTFRYGGVPIEIATHIMREVTFMYKWKSMTQARSAFLV